MAGSSANTIITLNFNGLPSKWKVPLDGALFYSREGMKIFPCHYVKVEKGKLLPEEDWKKPPLDGWPSGATTDVEQIKRWWTRWPDALIGHRPGDSGCVVFDVDVKHGSPGKANWDAFGFDLDDCARIARTRSGGWHYAFQRGDVGPVSNKDLCPGVNVRGDNGYVILPSPGSGYAWEWWQAPGPMPPKLADLLRSKQNEKSHTTGEGASSEPWKVTGALSRWRNRIERRWRGAKKKKAWIGYLTTTEQDLIPKLDEGNRSDIVWAMEKDFCEMGVPQGDAFEIIWPMAVCKWQGRRDGERSLREEIDKAYAEYQAEHPSADAKSYELVRASDITMKPKDWLWEGHLLRGALELLTGIPGLGKSQVQIGYIACVTTTKPWPDGTPSGPPMNVIMLTAEDALDDEVIPRLEAAGADRRRVHILKKIRTDPKTKRQFLLAEDLEELKRVIVEVGDVGLVTIDPITAYMGKINSSSPTDVRGQLGPLKDLAEETKVAFSAITHPPKSSSQRAIDHFIGSQAFIAAGRIGHLCVPEMDEEEKEPTGRILFTHPKHNPSKPKPTYAYRIESKVVQKHPVVIEAPYVVWDAEPVDITADQAVGAASGRGRGDDERSKEQRALQAFLFDMLKDGPVLVSKVEEDVDKMNFTDRQLRRARQQMRIESHKEEGVVDGKWWMCLPGGWNR